MAHDDDAPFGDELSPDTDESPRVVPARAPRPVQRREPLPGVAEPVVRQAPPAETPAAEPVAPPVPPPAARPTPPVFDDPYAIDLTDAPASEPLPTAPPERPRYEAPTADFWGDDIDDPRPGPFGRLQRRRDEEEGAGERDRPRRRFGRRNDPAPADDDFVPGQWSRDDWMPPEVPTGQWGPTDAAELDPRPPEPVAPPAPVESFDPPAPPPVESFDPPAPPPVEPPTAESRPLPPILDDDGFDPDPEPDDFGARLDDDLRPIQSDEPPSRDVFRRPEPVVESEPAPEPMFTAEPVDRVPPAVGPPVLEPEPVVEPEPVAEARSGRRGRKERRGADAAAAAAAAMAAAEATELAPPPAPVVPTGKPTRAEAKAAKARAKDEAKAAKELAKREAKEQDEREKAAKKNAPRKQRGKKGDDATEDEVLRRLFAGTPADAADVPELESPPVVETPQAVEPDLPAAPVADPFEAPPATPSWIETEPIDPGPVIVDRDEQFLDPEPEPPAAVEPPAQAPPVAVAPVADPVEPAELTQSRGLLATFVVSLATIAALLGIAVFWPVDVPPPATSPSGGTVERIYATVDTVTPLDCPIASDAADVPAARQTCGTVAVTAKSGEKFGFTVDSTQYAGGFRPGDKVIAAQQTDGANTSYTFVDYDRRIPLLLVAAVVGLLALGALRWGGVRLLASIGLSVAALLFFVLPSIRDGSSPLLVALSVAIVLGVVTMHLLHGFSHRTTAATIGLLGGLVLTAAIGLVVSRIGFLSGVGSDDGRRMLLSADRIDPSQITMAAAVIAALGVLLDLTSRQAATVFALREQDPRASAKTIVGRALSEARANHGTAWLTFAFAFAGAGLTGLLIASATEPGPVAVLNHESAAIELFRAGVCAIGAALAIPFTSWISQRLAPRAQVLDVDPPKEKKGRKAKAEPLSPAARLAQETNGGGPDPVEGKKRGKVRR